MYEYIVTILTIAGKSDIHVNSITEGIRFIDSEIKNFRPAALYENGDIRYYNQKWYSLYINR